MNAKAQRKRALAKGQRRRLAAVREREALRGAPVRMVVDALIHPSAALASMKLGTLFCPGGGAGIVPSFGRVKLGATLDAFNGDRAWQVTTRSKLRDLTAAQRRQFVRELVRHSPQSWRKAAKWSTPASSRSEKTNERSAA